MKKSLLVSLLGAGLLAGCGRGEPAAAPPIGVPVLSPSMPQTVSAGQPLSISATVTNDPQNAGVTWTATCTAPSCGFVSPSRTPSGMPTTYTAPNPVTAKLSITVTATSVTDITKSASLAVTVTPPPVSVTLSPSTPQTVAEGQTLSITATVANDPAGGGVNWTATCSATACGTLNPASTASGTPTTYTPPIGLTGSFAVTVTATSVTDDTKSASLTVTATPNNNASLSGDFAIRFTGFDPDGEVAVVARFRADGNGGLGNGWLDYNTPGGSGMTTFTGTYTVGVDNRGTLTASLTNPPGLAFVARFVLETKGSEMRIGRIIEFDDLTGTGARGSGEIDKQDLTLANLTTLAGDYALGFSGDLGSIIGRLGVVGRFTLGTDGAFSAGQVDASVPNSSFSSPLTGQVSALGPNTSTGRGTGMATIIIPSSSPVPSFTFNFAYYVVSNNQAFIVSTDSRSATSPLLSGEIDRQQQATFNAASLTGPIIFGVVGTCVTPTSSSLAHASVAIGLLQADGMGALTSGMFDQNECGTINSSVAINGGAYAVDPMVKGRVTITLGTNAKSLMLYLRDNDKGFLLEGTATTPSSEVTFGTVSPQVAPTGGFTEASLAGTYAVGTVEPSTGNVPNESGVVTFTSTSGSPSAFSGILDISQATTPFLLPGATFAGAYANTAVPGRFTAAATSMSQTPGRFVIYAITPGGFAMIEVTPGNTASSILFFEQ